MKSTEILMLNMWRWNRINYFCFIIDERTGLYFNDFGTFLSHLIEVEMQLHFRHQERRRGWKVLLKLSTLRSDWEKLFALPHHPSTARSTYIPSTSCSYTECIYTHLNTSLLVHFEWIQIQFETLSSTCIQFRSA